MARRGETLELAVLGLLHESPMHGYELRKQVNGVLGWGRLLSYGSLYPALKKMLKAGWIAEHVTAPEPGATSRRHRIVYELTPAGHGPVHARWWPTSARPRGRTTTSTSASRSSAAPTWRPGCGSWRAGAAGSRSGSTGCSTSSSAPSGRWTATPWSSSATAWSPSSARSGGSRT